MHLAGSTAVGNNMALRALKQFTSGLVALGAPWRFQNHVPPLVISYHIWCNMIASMSTVPSAQVWPPYPLLLTARRHIERRLAGLIPVNPLGWSGGETCLEILFFRFLCMVIMICLATAVNILLIEKDRGSRKKRRRKTWSWSKYENNNNENRAKQTIEDFRNN